MNEARRFLRYVMPVTAAVVVLLACFWVTAIETNQDINWQILNKLAGVGGAVALILASGGLGLLVATAYHLLAHSGLYRVMGMQVDLSRSLTWGKDNQKLKIVNIDDNNVLVDIPSLSTRDTWAVFVSLWHINLDNAKLKEAEIRCQSLWDLMHSSGALFTAALLAAITWIVICATDHADWLSWASTIALSFPIFAGLNMRRITKLTSQVTNSMCIMFLQSLTEAEKITVPYSSKFSV